MDKKEWEKIIKQLEAMSREFKVANANMNILINYFEALIDEYKDKNYFKGV